MQAMADLVFLVLGAVAVVGSVAIVALIAMEDHRAPAPARHRHADRPALAESGMMLRRFAAYRVLRIAAVAVPAIARLPRG